MANKKTAAKSGCGIPDDATCAKFHAHAAPQSSPLPWRISDGYFVDDDGKEIIFTPELKTLTIRRVNQGPSFDGMLDALEDMATVGERCNDDGPTQEKARRAYAALKLARGVK